MFFSFFDSDNYSERFLDPDNYSEHLRTKRRRNN